MQQPVRSEFSNTITALTGQSITIANWIDREGPNGGRNVIDQIDVFVTGSFTVATANWQGEDVARIASRIAVEQLDGTLRWNLPGDQSRIMAYECLGANKMFEHADVATGAAAAVYYAWQIPLAKPYAHTPGDFSLPVDEFKQITIDLNSLAGAATGTTVLTVPSLTFYAVAHVREELDVTLHCVDQIFTQDFQSQTQGVFEVNGRLQDFLIHVAGTSGGASLAAITDVRVDGFLPLLSLNDTKTRYRVLREGANNLSTTQAAEVRSDPFLLGAAPTALAMMVHGREHSPWTGKIWSSRMKVDVGTGVASSRAIMRKTAPLSQDARNRTMALYGLSPADLRVKTAGKSARDPMAWPPSLRPYLPLKGPLKSIRKAA